MAAVGQGYEIAVEINEEGTRQYAVPDVPFFV
jgi:hypothetical protein